MNETVLKGPNEKFCSDCGQVINAKAEICPKCGVRQMRVPNLASGNTVQGKSRIAAALFAIFLGGIGIHKFYLEGSGKASCTFCSVGRLYRRSLVLLKASCISR